MATVMRDRDGGGTGENCRIDQVVSAIASEHDDFIIGRESQTKTATISILRVGCEPCTQFNAGKGDRPCQDAKIGAETESELMSVRPHGLVRHKPSELLQLGLPTTQVKMVKIPVGKDHKTLWRRVMA